MGEGGSPGLLRAGGAGKRWALERLSFRIKSHVGCSQDMLLRKAVTRDGKRNEPSKWRVPAAWSKGTS